jgi:hypothetical protein
VERRTKARAASSERGLGPDSPVCSTLFFAFALALASPLPARAAPPDARLALEPGAPRIEKLPDGFDFVLVDSPSVLQAELLPTGELLLDPKSPGEARVFLFSRRLVRVLEVAVGRPLPAPDPPPTGACAKPRIDRTCHGPWARHLLHASASDTPLLAFEVEGLQEQAKAAKALLVSARLEKLDVAFSPFGVRIKGARDPAEKRRALLVIWPVVLGQLRLDD